MHGDHTGGNANFNTNQTTLVAQDNVRTRLKDRGQKNVADQKTSQTDYEKSLPEITHADGMTFYDGDETIMLMHVPQCAYGWGYPSILYERECAAHGRHLFCGSLPLYRYQQRRKY